jgi:drug/metabolite transporter (DMT)-like permease
LSERSLAKLLALAVAAAWGASFVAIKRVTDELSAGAAGAADVVVPFYLARFAMTSACFLPVLVIGRRELARYGARDWAWAVLVGIIVAPAYHLPLFFAARELPSALMAVIIATSPVITAVLARLFLAEPVGAARAAGVLVSFAGVATAVLVQHRMSQGGLALGGSGRGWFLYPALVGASALAAALWSVCGRAALKGKNPTVFVAAATVTATALTSFLWSGRAVERILSLSAWGWTAVAYLAVVATFLAYIGWYWSLGRLDASEITVFLNVTPLVALALGALIRNEAMSPLYLAGAAMVVAGVYITQRSPSAGTARAGESPGEEAA